MRDKEWKSRQSFETMQAPHLSRLPAIFIAGIEQARDFRQDDVEDRLEIDLLDGRHLEFPSHLFTADEFQALFAAHGTIVERAGLERLEHLCANDPCFIDRAAHVLPLVERTKL